MTAQATVKRDHYSRYLLPDPETGKERAWTRATTVANTLADRYGLEQWAKRNVALGIAARQDLYALASSYGNINYDDLTEEDKNQLNGIVSQAEQAAKARSGANLGTALHRITERVDQGDDLEIPDAWRADVDAYCQALVDHRLTIDPEWMERIVVLPEFGIAGTLDRLVTERASGPKLLADLKTGKDVVKYGMTEIAIQLAIYANAPLVWTGDDYQPMPTVYQDRALVIHLPVGEGRCDIHEVDIRAGWRALQAAVWVREWRKRKDLSTPYQKPGGEVAAAPDDDW